MSLIQGLPVLSRAQMHAQSLVHNAISFWSLLTSIKLARPREQVMAQPPLLEPAVHDFCKLLSNVLKLTLFLIYIALTPTLPWLFIGHAMPAIKRPAAGQCVSWMLITQNQVGSLIFKAGSVPVHAGWSVMRWAQPCGICWVTGT